MYFFKSPLIQRLIFGQFVWKVNNVDKNLYLTFDDGPTEEVTDYVLDTLDQYNAKATFFVVGKNVEKSPETLLKVLKAGHSVGNHTYSHVSGWKTNSAYYENDTSKCDRVLGEMNITTNLFRPPYGRINIRSIKKISLKKSIIMWGFLSGDFDQKLNIQKSLSSIKGMKSGEIIVFHDTKKAFDNLKTLLPETLDHFDKLGYQFKKIEI
ncbi:MAG: polysaccharide deacetylase family protein [Cyclobacteriaceae bacterium]